MADSPVPLLDALSSRMFLLGCAPRLSAIAPPTSVRGVPKKRSSPIKALDVGAGVGRITKDVLLPFCQHVDLVESSSHFLDQAVKDLSVPQVDCSIRFFLVRTMPNVQQTHSLTNPIPRTACSISILNFHRACTRRIYLTNL